MPACAVAMILISIFLIIPAGTFAASATVTGIYSLMKGMQTVEPSVLDLPFVAGVSIRASWSALEPEKERFEWQYVDEALRTVKKTHKKAMLRVLPGIHSPLWIYDQGIATLKIKDSNSKRDTGGREIQLPLPWDETYIREWIRFVGVLGERYSTNDAVTLVHIAGPTVRSAEMHLPKRGTGKTQIQDAAYSKEKIVSAWKKVIDAYAKAFPDKPLALNIAIPLKDDGAMEEIIAYGISRIGERLCLQGNWLSAYIKDSFTPYREIMSVHKQHKVTVGFQMLGTAKNMLKQGPLDKAVQKGLKAGARYFEIYEQDIREQHNIEFFLGLDREIR